MKINKKIIITIISIIYILMILSNFSYALNTGKYTEIYDNSKETTSISKISGYALGAVQAIGMVCSVVGMVVLGIKYMISSPNEKATIKDKAVIYVVGLIILFSGSALVGMIGNWARENVK